MSIRKNYPAKLIRMFLFCTTAFILSNCKKENLDTDLMADSANLASSTALKSQLLAASNLSMVTSSSHYLESSLPAGYVKDGSRDYTTVIQAAILKYPNIVFPAFPILINEDGLNVPSNRVLTFLDGSELRMKPNSQAGYGMLTMRNATNVTLVNPVLKGDRYKHLGTSGEWGMGISIYGGSNITVLSPEAREMWGDGMYIGVENGVIPKNITIKNAVLEYNRRDGITIVAADGLKMESPYAAFSNGTKPMAGIAFEPNNSRAEIKNVVITNPRTEGNAGHGMFVDFGNLMGGGQKTVGVTVHNHTDVKSKVGMTTMSRVTDGSSTIKGDLTFVNPVWAQNYSAIFTILYGSNDVHLKIENPIIRNLSNTQLSKDNTLSTLRALLNPKAREITSINFTSVWPNMVTSVISPILSTSPSSSAVFAVNAGGPAVTASNGITYQADKNFSGGNTFETSEPIANTSSDALYQSERYGDFSYNIPVSDGTYEVTFLFSEIFHSASGKRRFDAFMEGVQSITDLDIYANVGALSKYQTVKQVQVTDGTLNIRFDSDVDYAKVAAFHVVKK